MSQISVNALTFAYNGSYDNIFENTSFRFDTDWKLGFVGRNGRGKTTFLRLLMGQYPYSGSISASVQFEYFPFDVPERSFTTQEVLDTVSGGAPFWQLKRELSLLGMEEETLYRPFDTLSHGERTKALLAAQFIKGEHYLLIDEPTNHLDLNARKVVAAYLNAKRGFLLVSHDRVFLDGCVDHILCINKTGLEVMKGNFSTWMHNKELQDAFERDENEKRIAEIKKLSDAARRTANWSDRVESTKIGQGVYDRGAVGHKAAKMMKRAKAIENRRESAIEEKEKLLKNIEYASPLILRPLIHHAARLVEARGLSICYGGHKVFEDLDLEVEQGRRIALTGKNGCGKSSIVKLLAGENIPHGGTLRLASGLIVSYVPQDTSFLAGETATFASSTNIDLSLFMTILRKLDFPRTQFEKDMRTFSAGQRKKVLIAKSLCEQAHLYLWDEPLNYIDVLSRMQIEELIKSYTPTMLFVEHDRAFIDAVATDVVEM